MASLNDYLNGTAESFAKNTSFEWNSIAGKRIAITGATGLIGSQLVRSILAANRLFNTSISLVLPVRNIDKAIGLFGSSQDISYLQWSLGESLAFHQSIDYLIHAACGTSSRAFTLEPATTIAQIVNGGEETLKAAVDAKAQRYLFLSTMEVYGEVEGLASEENLGKLDPMVVRNCYPEAKRLVECLASSYAVEHDLSTSVLRLAQTFGQGVVKEDMRVFADFGRHAISGDDIVLLSDGLKRNGYLSIDDAVSAILTVLVKGKTGEAYNAVNQNTYCSIKEMAEMVLASFGDKNAALRREYDPEREATFRKSSDLQLDTSKLESLGWIPTESLQDMYRMMIVGWEKR